MQSHRGIVVITSASLLTWLDFDGGRIRACEKDILTDGLRVVIEHPDMPLVDEGTSCSEVQVSHEACFDAEGRQLSVERVNPPKGRG